MKKLDAMNVEEFEAFYLKPPWIRDHVNLGMVFAN